MLAWQAGDEGAFDRLVEAYSGRVYALLTRFLGRHPSREDLVQEVFLRVIRARDRYVPTAKFTTWLYRIVFNLSVNETQRSGRREEALTLSGGHGDGGEEGLDVEDLEGPAPSSGLEQLDVVDAVRAAIEELPEQQRMALVLAKYEDMPYVDIGRVLGITDKAVKSLVHRARETLRGRLAPFMKEVN